MKSKPIKPLILYEHGAITEIDLLALKRAGYEPIGCRKRDEVSMLLPTGMELAGDEILKAAIQSMSGPNSGSERQKFGEALMRLIVK